VKDYLSLSVLSNRNTSQGKEVLGMCGCDALTIPPTGEFKGTLGMMGFVGNKTLVPKMGDLGKECPVVMTVWSLFGVTVKVDG
jgi:hypothetical protein